MVALQSGVIFNASTKKKKQTRQPQKRFERRDNPPPFKIAGNHRLFQICYWLLKLRFLETRQIARLLYKSGSRKYAERQLRALYDQAYIDRLPWPVERFWGKHRIQLGSLRALHCPDEAGARFLAEQLEVSRKDIDWRPRDNRKPGNMEHTLALNDFLITAHLAAQRQGWRFDILQTEREVNRSDGHDRVHDPKTKKRVTVKPDSVCRLVFTPSQRGIYFSVELDRGTEGPKKIKAKLRAHLTHFTGGAYQKRHGTTSSRILFVVADVRDPLHPLPLSKAEWKARVRARCEQMKSWAEAEIPGSRRDLFWFVPLFDLTEETIFRAPIWLRAGLKGKWMMAEADDA